MSSGVNGINSAGFPGNYVQVVESLLTDIRTLSSSNSLQEIMCLLGEIPGLRKVIEAKDKELEKTKAEHSDFNQKSHKLYEEWRAKAEAENSALKEKVSSLNTDLGDRDNTIGELKNMESERRRHECELENSLEKQRDIIQSIENRKKELQTELDAMDVKIEKLGQDLAGEQSKVLELRKELDALKEEKASLSRSLQISNGRIKELETLAEPLHEADLDVESIKGLEDVWKSAYKLVESYFGEDLPDNSLQNTAAWKKLKEPKIFQHQIPLPQTNTSAAKQMRIAVVLAILARFIDKYIFQPTYILEEDSGIREILRRQAESNSKRESLCRALLLAMFPDEQAEATRQRVTQVVISVMWEIQDLLTEENAERFKSKLEKVAQNASDIWLNMQRARERFEPSFELSQSHGRDWQALPLDEGRTGEQAPMNSGSEGGELCVIFPRLYIVEDNEYDPITHGVVLRRSQSVVAARELEKGRASRRTSSARSKRGSRRLSIAMNGGGNSCAEVGTHLSQVSGSSGG